MARKSTSFRHQAQIWEEEDGYDKLTGATIYARERRFIDQCFSEERTRQWSTRLGHYWAHYGAASGPSLGYMLHRKTKCLPDGRQAGSLHQKFDAVGLTRLLDRCRQARIGSHFHGFMHLPAEIRTMIYSYALVTDSRFVITSGNSFESDAEVAMFMSDAHVGGDIYQRFLDDDENRPLRGRGPSFIFKHRGPTTLGPMGLLQGVCHTIHAEAMRVFLSRNQLIIVHGKLDYPIGFNRRRFPWSDYYWLDTAGPARDVSYSFDMRDHVVSDYDNLNFGNSLRKEDADYDEIQPADAMLALHNDKTAGLEYMWVDRIDAIKAMTLDRLQLSLDECFCSVGCCRKVCWVLDALVYPDLPPGRSEEDVYCNTDWKTRPPLVIEVMGWRSGKEKARIQEKLGLLKSPEPIEIRFLEDTRKRVSTVLH